MCQEICLFVYRAIKKFHSASLTVRTICCSLTFTRVNDELLGFRLLVGPKKQFEDITVGSGILQ